MQKTLQRFLILFLIPLSSGCVGFDPLPNLWKHPPFTWFRGGEQIGRDQLTNRQLVAMHLIPVTGKHENEILSLLGQPSATREVERNVSEDWLFIYYKKKPDIKKRIDSETGQFLVRFYHEKVIDVIRDL